MSAVRSAKRSIPTPVALRVSRPHKPAVKPRWSLTGTLASVRFAVLVVVVLALACVAGTVIPQGADAIAYLRTHPESEGRFALLDAIGLTHVFTSWWFLGLMGVLGASIVACSSKRFMALFRTSGFAWRRCLGSLLTHVIILLILGGAIVRGVWGVRGYVELNEGAVATEFQTDDGARRPLPAPLRLNRFEIETDGPRSTAAASRLLVRSGKGNVSTDLPVLLGKEQTISAAAGAESWKVQVLEYQPDFIIDPETRKVGSRSTSPKNPAILVAVDGPGYHNHRWLFARFPGFSREAGGEHDSKPCPLDLVYQVSPAAPQGDAPVKSFNSHVEFLPAGTAPVSGTVRVNGPLSFGGYTFYQSGYRPDQPGWTSLQIVRDPGVPMVYAGFILMIAGLALVFYVNAWVTPRGSAS